MILGVDGWSRHDEDADHLAHQVREVVRRHLGEPVADRAVVATHEVRLSEPHLAVSCRVPDDPAALEPGRYVPGLVDDLTDLVGSFGGVAVSAPGLPDGVAVAGRADALTGAWVAVAAAATRASGRLVHYPGEHALVDRLTVADVLAASCVDAVLVLGGGAAEPTTVVDTRGFVRPRVVDGRVELLVQPAVGGVMVPFEKENPERCCEDH